MVPISDLTQVQYEALLADNRKADMAALEQALLLHDLLNRAYRMGQEAAGAVVVAEAVSSRRQAMIDAMRRAYAASSKATWDRTMVEVVLAAFDACGAAEPEPAAAGARERTSSHD